MIISFVGFLMFSCTAGVEACFDFLFPFLVFAVELFRFSGWQSWLEEERNGEGTVGWIVEGVFFGGFYLGWVFSWLVISISQIVSI